MIDIHFVEKEYQRHTLENFGRILSEDGFEADLTADNGGNWRLGVKVPGPSGYFAGFSLRATGTGIFELSAFYVSPLVEGGLSDSWTIGAEDDPEDICSELIAYFVEDCADKEYETILVPTMINDENLQYFVPLLSDKILSEENIYALGVFAKDEGGLEVAAAAGFYVTVDELVIEDIAVRPEYDDLGIEDYLLRYIPKLVFDTGIFGF